MGFDVLIHLVIHCDGVAHFIYVDLCRLLQELHLDRFEAELLLLTRSLWVVLVVDAIRLVGIILSITDRPCLDFSCVFEGLYDGLSKDDFLLMLILFFGVLLYAQLSVPLGDPCLEGFRRKFTLILDDVLAVAFIE